MTDPTLPNLLKDPEDRRLPRLADPSTLVLFGVTGDLAKKKLLPAMYDLANRGLLTPGFGMVGFGRRDWTDDDFRAYVREAVIQHTRTGFREQAWAPFAEGLRFVQGTFSDADAFDRLAACVDDLERTCGTRGNAAFYLSIPPKNFDSVIEQLDRCGLAAQREGAWRRVIIEKPFGHDLASAKQLNDVVARVFPAESVFRIDHYLGKETVQNLLAFRFSNQLFEPVWNNHYVSHVQITMAEEIGIGSRAGYYDGIGAARDVIQNHLLQLLALTAMEEPNNFDAAQLRAEKLKVLAAVKLPERLDLHTARGQYCAGYQGGRRVPGFLEEDGVDPNSHTETYAAIRLDIDSRRWAGVPFYVRSAKRMPRRTTEVALVFKRVPHLPFAHTDTKRLGANALIMRIQPNEGITVRFGSKVPDTQMEIRQVGMDFSYNGSFTESSPEAYERLILDVLRGDPPLFPQQQEVETSWRILDPVLDFWASLDDAPQQYPSGTWGPSSSDEMLAHDGFSWRRP